MVVALDSTQVNFVWHKVWTFNGVNFPYYAPTHVSVIEGIGCVQDPTYMLKDYRLCVECIPPYMYCFSNNGYTPPVIPQVGYFFDNTSSCDVVPTLSLNSFTSPGGGLMVYPNPCTNMVTLSFPEKDSRVTIFNTIGQVMFNESNVNQEVTVDVSNYPVGIYIISVNGVVTKKLVKNSGF